MKVLLIHAEDDPEKGPWASLPWDRIFDLGRGGAETYARWSKRFGCRVEPLDSRNGFDDFRQVRDLLGRGCGQLVDDYGLDWWEIMSILLTGEVETLILLQRLLQTLNSRDLVYVSRPGLHADVLRLLLGTAVQVFPARGRAAKLRPGHYLRLSAKLSKAQMVDIFWDKYDPGYQLRGRIVAMRPGSRPSSKQPLVLLPSAYVNVSRTGIQYANTFSEERFLLVTTRRSGWVQEPPPNVATAWLSSYASVRDRANENREMQSRWESLKRELTAMPEFDVLNRLGQLASFPRRFRHGIEVRDAWRNVVDREPVQAVLCADDSNPYTRIPLLLARERGLLNIACHHGALDGRYVFKRSHADIIWAKGRMEADYLVRMCGVPREKVEVGAPALPAGSHAGRKSGDQASPQSILFFSELYEACGGRPEEFYRDVLPHLADMALATGRELVVKLHPAESERERTLMLARILSAKQRDATRVVSGPLTDDLLAKTKTWFGVTILSTVAMECAVRGIPCFLCKWLEFSPHEYVEQFIRFGVGIGLDSKGGLEKIPQYLREYAVQTSVRENCWHPAAPGRLHQLLTFSRRPCAEVAS
ncbi:MAG: hypothetical protein WB562_01130 [Candidatus Sulfotelmatobacter sp.]